MSDSQMHVVGIPCRLGHTLRYFSSGHCVECAKTSSRNHPERQVKYKKNNPEQVLLSAAKYRAKKFGIPFSITVHDLPPVPEVCPVLGIPIYSSPGKAKDNSPSLDKIVPLLGYVPGNVHWISWRANRLKSDATVDELTKLANYFTNMELSTNGTEAP
jgi:hypothetical protein